MSRGLDSIILRHMAAAQDELEQQRLEGIVPWSLEAERLREAADEATMAEFLRLLVEDLSPHGGEGSDLPEKVAPTGARFLRAVSQPIYVRGGGRPAQFGACG